MRHAMCKQICIALACVALLSVTCANRLRINRLRDALHLSDAANKLHFHNSESCDLPLIPLEAVAVDGDGVAALAAVNAIDGNDKTIMDFDEDAAMNDAVVGDDNNDNGDNGVNDDNSNWHGIQANSMSKRNFMNYPQANVMAIPHAIDDPQPADAVAIAVPLSAVNEAMIEPMLPISDYQEFYDDLLVDAKRQDVKRNGMPSVIGCDCKVRNDLLDLGPEYFPRYLLNAVCQQEKSTELTRDADGVHVVQKCRGATYCKALEYKVKVLTRRAGRNAQARMASELQFSSPQRALRMQWRFKTITVAAGCFCSY